MIALLGASGNVGGKIADALIKRGERVRVVGEILRISKALSVSERKCISVTSGTRRL